MGGEDSDDSLFMPFDYFLGCVYRVGGYILCISIVHIFILLLLEFHHWCSSKQQNQTSSVRNGSMNGKGALANGKSTDRKETKKEIWALMLKNSVQMTNMLVNLCLGSYGLYLWFFILPNDCSDEEKVIGINNFSECAAPSFFSEVQLGYQIWSLPLSFLVGEPIAMTFHHFGTAVIASLGAMLVKSFRYFSVFFFGVIEFSSVPLSIMNIFKSRPDWIHTMPKFFAFCKVAFASSFLCTRVILWAPQLYDIFRLGWPSKEQGIYLNLVYITGVSLGVFLTCLQYFWATKIVKGLLQMAGINLDNDEQNSKNSMKRE